MQAERLYETCTVIEIDTANHRRAKVHFERLNFDSGWLKIFSPPSIGAGKEGIFSNLKVGDCVLVSYLDYPNNQQPFIAYKYQADDDDVPVNTEKVIQYNEHIIKFETDKITITQKDGLAVIVMEGDKISFQSDKTSAFTMVRYDLLKIWLENHFHLGNLLFPTATPLASGYPWNPLIESKNLKIS